MLVRLSCGQIAKIEVPFLIFTNKNRSYLIQGVLDTISGGCYRSGPKRWMETANMLQLLHETCAITALSNGRMQTLFIYNCSSHTINE